MSEVTRDEWIGAFASEAGVSPPSPQELDQLLALAATAAHASERTSAPIACWIAGRAELPLEELLESAERIGEGSSPPQSASGPAAG
jgi:uncharacterized protein DUF6457